MIYSSVIQTSAIQYLTKPQYTYNQTKNDVTTS